MKKLLRNTRSLWRSWPVVALGAGLGLIVGSIIDATAQDIVDPEEPAPVRAQARPSPLFSLPAPERAPVTGAAPGPRLGVPASGSVDAAPLLEALSARSEALNQQIATINAGETALALQLREIEARLEELRELQRTIDAGCAATHAAQAAQLAADRAAAEAEAERAAVAQAEAAEAEAEAAEAEAAQANQEATAGAPAARPAPAAPTAEELEGERQREERLVVLTETVRAMRDDNAATLIETLDLDLAAAILRRMSPRDTGRILDRITPERAAELSEALLEPEEN